MSEQSLDESHAEKANDLKEASGGRSKESFSFRFDAFSEIESALEEIFSPSAASVILYAAANKCGKRSCKEIMEKVETKEAALDYLSKLKSEENWGKLIYRDIDFKNGSGKLIIIDSFETVARKASESCCHLFRGFLSGFLSELFAKSIMVTEEKCAGKGDQYCEFVFK